MAKLNEGDIVSVTGYLYYAVETTGFEGKDGKMKGESCNCQLFKPGETDFHVGIGFDRGIAAKVQNTNWPLTGRLKSSTAQNSIVVEMTPEYRAEFEPEWTIDALKKAKGKQVKVVGQLIADNEHLKVTDDCGRATPRKSCWRMSIWEVHPVTAFFVCKGDGLCEEDDSNWVALEKF